jgi:hypothetical protein
MIASTFAKRAHRALVLPAVLAAVLMAGAPTRVNAQQSGNPGNIIVESTVTPRDAFIPVPKSQDPVAVSATTFPATVFNPAMAAIASDLDLTNAHGSSGVSSAGVNGSAAGLQAINMLLTGSATGNNKAAGANALPQQGAGIGGQISTSVTSALAPLGAALGALK